MSLRQPISQRDSESTLGIKVHQKKSAFGSDTLRFHGHPLVLRRIKQVKQRPKDEKQGLTNPTLLNSSKWYTRATDQSRVRPYHTHLKRLRDAPHPSHIPTEKVPRQPGVGVVGHGNDLFLSVELDQRGDGTERLLTREEGGGGDVGEDGWGVEGTDTLGLGSIGGVAADEDARTEGDCVVDVSDDFGYSTVVDERPVCSMRASVTCALRRVE